MLQQRWQRQTQHRCLQLGLAREACELQIRETGSFSKGASWVVRQGSHSQVLLLLRHGSVQQSLTVSKAERCYQHPRQERYFFILLAVAFVCYVADGAERAVSNTRTTTRPDH